MTHVGLIGHTKMCLSGMFSFTHYSPTQAVVHLDHHVRIRCIERITDCSATMSNTNITTCRRAMASQTKENGDLNTETSVEWTPGSVSTRLMHSRSRQAAPVIGASAQQERGHALFPQNR